MNIRGLRLEYVTYRGRWFRLGDWAGVYDWEECEVMKSAEFVLGIGGGSSLSRSSSSRHRCHHRRRGCHCHYRCHHHRRVIRMGL